MSQTPNAGQAAYWNDAAGPTWARLQTLLDRQLEPLGRAATRALGPLAGLRVLDIGCGAGATTLQLAESVGPKGEVVGLDISRTLLDVARARSGDRPVRFVEADAQAYGFEPAGFDAAFSRFGVMFFEDPATAFANIRRGLRPGAPLAFVCWRAPGENPIMTLPMAAAQTILEPPPPPEPGAPGPFAFADPDRVQAILADAGFGQIEIQPHDEKIGAGSLEDALEVALQVGPLGALIRENPQHRDAVIGAVREALSPHVGVDGLKLASATWIVTARA